MLTLLALACNGASDPDTGPSIDALCEGAGDLGLTIGQGASEQFTALADGDEVGLISAPQGGVGVSVRARTSGLATGTVSVQLDTYLDGALSASHTNKEVELYCQDDGAGLLWGVVVGFDTSFTESDLLGLDGESAELVVIVTDANNTSAEARIDVTVRYGG